MGGRESVNGIHSIPSCLFIPMSVVNWHTVVITMEPPNKGHFGDNINSAVLSFVERFPSSRRFRSIRTIGKQIFGTLNCVLCREVYYTVSLSRRVHYRRFHCMIVGPLVLYNNVMFPYFS